METLRDKYRGPYRPRNVRFATDSAVLEQSFVAESLRRDEPRNDAISAFRGAVNAILMSLVFWCVLGLTILVLI